MRDFITKTLSTFFYVGYLPAVPGTFASLAALFLFYLIKDNIFIYALSIIISISLGLLVSSEAEKLFKRKDAKCIVIDEVAGMLLSVAFMPYDFKLAVIAFFLFRILDTLKPYPADNLQNLKGGLGVMSDDIVAGVYTNIILQVVRFASFKAS